MNKMTTDIQHVEDKNQDDRARGEKMDKKINKVNSKKQFLGDATTRMNMARHVTKEFYNTKYLNKHRTQQGLLE
jgi:predicted solute-binding protein